MKHRTLADEIAAATLDEIALTFHRKGKTLACTGLTLPLGDTSVQQTVTVETEPGWSVQLARGLGLMRKVLVKARADKEAAAANAELAAKVVA